MESGEPPRRRRRIFIGIVTAAENQPGDKMMRGELGDAYVEKLRRRYEGRVRGGADLVTYWFEKARTQIEAGKVPVWRLYLYGSYSKNTFHPDSDIDLAVFWDREDIDG